MATIAEVADGIYRVNIEVPQSPVTFSFFVVKDEQPTLVQTGFSRLFDESLGAVKKIIDPTKLRYIVVPHFEGDECGALNQFLGQAPHAQPICSPIGALSNLLDEAAMIAPAAEAGGRYGLGYKPVSDTLTMEKICVQNSSGLFPYSLSQG